MVEVMFVVVFVPETCRFPQRRLPGLPGEAVEIDEEQTILESPDSDVLQPADGTADDLVAPQ